MWRDSNLQLFHRSSLRPSIDLVKIFSSSLFDIIVTTQDFSLSILHKDHPVYVLRLPLSGFGKLIEVIWAVFLWDLLTTSHTPRLSFVIATFSFICCFIIFSIVSFFGYSKRRIEYPKSANYLNISSEKYIQNIFLNLVMPKHSSQSQNKIQPKNSFGGWAFAKLRTGK